MTQLSTVTTKGQVTIPVSIRQKWGIKPQERVVFIESEDAVELKPAVDFFSLKGSVKSRKRYADSRADAAVGELLAKDYAQTIEDN